MGLLIVRPYVEPPRQINRATIWKRCHLPSSSGDRIAIAIASAVKRSQDIGDVDAVFLVLFVFADEALRIMPL
jgi:hypothetical protein